MLTQKEIDELWKAEVQRRIEEVRSGRVRTIPAEQVFAEIESSFKMKGFKTRTKSKKFERKP